MNLYTFSFELGEGGVIAQTEEAARSALRQELGEVFQNAKVTEVIPLSFPYIVYSHWLPF